MNTVWVVTDAENAPGRLLAVFNNRQAAVKFSLLYRDKCDMEEYNVYGDPSMAWVHFNNRKKS